MRMTATIVEHMPATLLGIWQISFNPYDTSIPCCKGTCQDAFWILPKRSREGCLVMSVKIQVVAPLWLPSSVCWFVLFGWFPLRHQGACHSPRCHMQER